MVLPFYLQILVAAALGVSFWLFQRQFMFVKTAARALFVLAQLALIYFSGLSALPGLLIVVALLCGYVALLRREEPARPMYQSLSVLFFSGFLVYWLIQKYLLPLGIDTWLNDWIPWLGRENSSTYGIMMVGVSYIGFKFIHFFVDFRAGKIKDVDPLEFLGWLLFFPSIIAGPMQRFQEWQAQRAELNLTTKDVVSGLQRLLTGLFMKFVMADTIYNASIFQSSAGTLATASLVELVGSAACYSFYLYWDFAGYSHMAIGLGKFWGVTLPENFRSPFLARNLAEFWNRWHITLSTILRDYIFYPLSLHLKRLPFSRRHPDIAAVIPPLITFLLVGIWHGATIGFILYGLTQGIGLAFVAVLKRRKPKTALSSWWARSIIGYAIGVILNFAYVTLSLVFFGLSRENLLVLWHRLVSANYESFDSLAIQEQWPDLARSPIWTMWSA
jgi:D-alanyl-lipoteichoic acid acyltransferase DltB (MBOAT superfamily)